MEKREVNDELDQIDVGGGMVGTELGCGGLVSNVFENVVNFQRKERRESAYFAYKERDPYE